MLGLIFVALAAAAMVCGIGIISLVFKRPRERSYGRAHK